MPHPLIGHTHIRDFFTAVLRAERLAHAYCFVGPSQIGKRTVATDIAATLLHVPYEKVMTHPDVLYVGQEMNEKTGKTKKNIDVEQIREVRTTLTQHAFMGMYKIVIIDGAEKMSQAAANALLKTLEEPRPNTILFLLTTHAAHVPATIRSRCQLMYFHPVKEDVLRQYIDSRGVHDVGEQNLMLRLSRGLPGRLIEWLDDPDVYEGERKEVERFYGLFHKPLYEKIANVDDLFGDKTDTVAARENLQDVLALWQMLLSSVVHEQADGRSLSHGWRQEDILVVDAMIQQAREGLERNFHPRLLIEHILLSIP